MRFQQVSEAVPAKSLKLSGRVPKRRGQPQRRPTDRACWAVSNQWKLETTASISHPSNA